jgi:hypothetical protein
MGTARISTGALLAQRLLPPSPHLFCQGLAEAGFGPLLPTGAGIGSCLRSLGANQGVILQFFRKII